MLLVVAGVVGVQLVVRSFIHAYYDQEYRPEALTAAELGQPPPSHRLTDVPWLSEKPGLCQSISLRMLAAQQGRLEPRPTLDFLMGFTWGATATPGRTTFFPGQDPEPGFLRAAPYLGFTRRYLTTDRPEDLVRAVRTFVSNGRAVRVALDRAQLLDGGSPVPHSVVLIGYDADGFEYYEPTCDDPARCTAMEHAPGQPGLTVTTAQLLLAQESQARVFQYPWRYQLLVLEPSSAPVPDWSTLLGVNGRALVGAKSAGPSTGSVAVNETADALERQGKTAVTPELLRGLETAALVRRDDALALRSLFVARPDLAPAAASLDAAATEYQRAATALEAKALEQGVAALRQAAGLDRKAGEVLLQGGPDGG